MMSMKHGEGLNGHRTGTLVDPSISINMQSPEEWIRGLSALPTNHPRIFGNTDLTELPCYDGTQVIVKLLNEVFLFCTWRMLNHQVLLSFLQGLLICSEGMKIRVRQWMKKLDVAQFVIETDPEDDKGISPAVTRMIIHIVWRLCRDFYVKPQRSSLEMLNELTASDFGSIDNH
jgi:hypothetical protein